MRKTIQIEYPYLIQKIELIEVFNMAVVCLVNQTNTTNHKVRLINFKTGQQISEEKTCYGIPQIVEYISSLDLLLIGMKMRGFSEISINTLMSKEAYI